MSVTNRLFRKFRDEQTAKSAAKAAATADLFVACANGLVGALALNGIQAFPGISGVDCIVEGVAYLIVAWRTARMSRGWSLFGFCLFAIDSILLAAAIPITMNATRLLLIIVMLNGVRGCFAYHRFRRSRPPEIRVATAPSLS